MQGRRKHSPAACEKRGFYPVFERILFKQIIKQKVDFFVCPTAFVLRFLLAKKHAELFAFFASLNDFIKKFFSFYGRIWRVNRGDFRTFIYQIIFAKSANSVKIILHARCDKQNVILKTLAIFGDDFVVIWQNLRDILLYPFYLFIDKLGFFVKHIIKRVNSSSDESKTGLIIKIFIFIKQRDLRLWHSLDKTCAHRYAAKSSADDGDFRRQI